MKLVASMIVHNEADRYLEPVLEHLLTYVDEIRIVDDGSTDDWTRVQLDDRIRVHHESASTFYVHEGQARQRLLEWTLEAHPTHILAVDADEVIEDPESLLSAISEGHDVIRLCMMEVWGCDANRIRFRIDGGWKPHEAPLVYKVRPGMTIPQRKLASGRIPEGIIGRGRTRSAGVGIYHFGWACESDREARYARYAEHDGGKFHASSHLDSILWHDDDPRLVLCRDRWPAGLDSVKDRLVERSNR